VVKQRTASGRLTRALKAITTWCRRNLHLPLDEQHRILCLKLRGHNAYYGITGNAHSLVAFRQGVRRIWRKWLGRRSQRTSTSWDWFNRVHTRYPLPTPTAIHSTLRYRAAKPAT
jgi:hypothetical protein